ncbi:MAG: hypothetical protein ACJ8C9_12080 [Microvirga sp.]
MLTVLSTYDLVLSQLLPEAISRQLPRLYDVLLVAAPWIPAWAIPMTILTLLGFSAMAAVNRRFSALGVTLAGFDQKLADVRSLNDQNLADVRNLNDRFQRHVEKTEESLSACLLPARIAWLEQQKEKIRKAVEGWQAWENRLGALFLPNRGGD